MEGEIVTNGIDDIGYDCNMKKCKNVSLEIGRFISELTSKAMAKPTPTISDEDIDKLGQYLGNWEQTCGITDGHMKSINEYYKEIGNIYPTARGSRLTPPLSDLSDSIHVADSYCKCRNVAKAVGRR